MSDITFIDDEGPLPQYPKDPRVLAGLESSWWQDVNDAVYRGIVWAGAGAGIVGDGVTDDSAALQSLIDRNKGRTIVIPSNLTPLIKGVTLSGATYNGTKIIALGELQLATRINGADTTFGGAFIGILFKDCDNCGFDGLFNGRRAAQFDEQHIYCIALAAATNFTSKFFQAREIKGDGIYISQSNWFANSANSQNCNFGIVQGWNSADDGRNLMSIIACEGLTCSHFSSTKVGGVVGGVRMPGGLDIEPDFVYQPCTDIVFGTVNVVSAGNFGVGIACPDTTNDVARTWPTNRVVFGSVNLKLTAGISGSAMLFLRCRNISVGRARILDAVGAAGGIGVAMDFADKIKGNFDVFGAHQGMSVGFSDFCNDCDISLNVDSPAGATAYGLRTTGTNRSIYRVKVNGFNSAASTFAVQTRSNTRGITQTAVTYHVHAPYDGFVARAFRNEPGDLVTYGAGTHIAGGDMSGYASFSVQCDAQIRSQNVVGRNLMNGLVAAPANGAWAQGDVVHFTQAAGATPPAALCIASGTPGTWKTYANIAP